MGENEGKRNFRDWGASMSLSPQLVNMRLPRQDSEQQLAPVSSKSSEEAGHRSGKCRRGKQ